MAPIRLSIVSCNVRHLALLITTFSFFVSPIYGAEGGRCDRLFKDRAALATCNTLANMYGGEISDDDLRERVSNSVYGVSADKLDEVLEKRESERKRLEAEDRENLEKTDQCYRLFSDVLERETCRTLRMLTYRNRTDEEMRKDVRDHLVSKQGDLVNERKRAQDAELKRRDYDAWLQRNAREEEQRRKVEAQRERQAAIESEKRRKAAGVALDKQLSQGSVGFLFRSWEKGGFGTILIIHFTLQNNTASPLKDFEITCRARGNSDTLLASPSRTLYERLGPGARGSFSLNLGLIDSQTAKVSCVIAKWGS